MTISEQPRSVFKAALDFKKPVRIRLAYLVSQYPAVSHTFIFREIAGLRDRGFDIRICSVNPPDRDAGEMPADEAHHAAEVYCLKALPRFAILGWLALECVRSPVQYLRGLLRAWTLAGSDARLLLLFTFYWAEAILLGRWMRDSGCAHVHVHFASAAATVALLTSRMFPVTFSFTAHGPDEFYDSHRMLLASKVRGAAFVVCISDFARSQLMLLSDPSLWDKLHVIPLGVDPDEFRMNGVARIETSPAILCIARCVPAKGLDILLEAAAGLASQGMEFALQIVGDGPDRERLIGLARQIGLGQKCRFLGAVRRTKVSSILAQASVFVLPSFAEGVPVSLMEAMASGVPCVSTRIAGIPELIRDGVDGLLVPPGNTTELARAIRAILEDETLRTSIRRHARTRIEDRYNLPVNLDRLKSLLEDELEECHDKRSATGR